jgi:hypothetical protein
MVWKSEFLTDERVLEIVFGKDFQSNELPDLLKDTVVKLNQNNCLRVLADCSALEKTSSLFKIYDFPKLYVAQGLDRRTKEAVLLPLAIKPREALKFYETVCRNLGLHVKAFDDRPAALEWLHQ